MLEWVQSNSSITGWAGLIQSDSSKSQSFEIVNYAL